MRKLVSSLYTTKSERTRLVHVTQGTVATDPEALIVPTLRTLAQEDVLVVATTAGKPIKSIPPDAVPTNARIESFIPHPELLPDVDVMITNGVYNGVQMALANGVPLVAAGQSEDKPEVCARIEWTGVGINLKTGEPTQQQIRSAVKKLLADNRYKTREGLSNCNSSVRCVNAGSNTAGTTGSHKTT